MRVDISGYQFFFPQTCACCSAPAQTSRTILASQTIGKGRLGTTHTRAWNIPYCKSCAHHVRIFEASLWVVLILALLDTFASLVVLFNTGSITETFSTWCLGLGICTAIFLLLIRTARRSRVPGCTGLSSAVTYIGWQGSQHAFFIRSYRFAYDFMSLNERKLINLHPKTVVWLKRSGIDQTKAPQTSTRYLPRVERRK